MSSSEQIGLEDFFRTFLKYWYITVSMTIIFMIAGLIAVQFAKGSYSSQASVYSKGFEKGFSDESGHDILAVSRLPVVYKETGLRLLLEDVRNNQVAGRNLSLAQRTNLTATLKQKIEAIVKGDVFAINLNNPTEKLLSNIINTPTSEYNEKLLRRNTEINFIGKSYIIEINYKTFSRLKAGRTVNTITDIFIRMYNKAYTQKVLDLVVSKLEQDKILAEQEYVGMVNDKAAIAKALKKYQYSNNYITIQSIRNNPKVVKLKAQLLASDSTEEKSQLTTKIQQELSTVWEDEKIKYMDPDEKLLLQQQIQSELLFQKAQASVAVLTKKIDYYKKNTLKAIPQPLAVMNYGEVPVKSLKPFSKIHVLLLGFIGFFLSNWVIFAIEAYHPGLKTTELQDKTGKKIIGMIPANHHKKMFEQGMAYFSLFLNKENTKIMLFSSNQQSEGKTFIAAQTALYLSKRLGKKVLLIDGNYKAPYLHKLFQLNNLQYGFSDLLSRGTAVLNQAIRQLPKIPTLSIMPYGTASFFDHLASLINVMGLDSLLKNLANSYDYIIFDGPTINHKYLEYIPSYVSVFMVHDSRAEIGNNKLKIYQEYQETIKGIFINHASNQQLQSFYGEECTQSGSLNLGKLKPLLITLAFILILGTLGYYIYTNNTLFSKIIFSSKHLFYKLF